MRGDDKEKTEFLPQRILYDESGGRQKLEKEIARIHRRRRAARRAAGRMAILLAFVAAAIGYPMILRENFSRHAPPFMMNLAYALVVGSLVSLLVFVILARVYRKRLVQCKEDCRLKAASSLPHATAAAVGHKNDGTAQIPGEADAAP